MTIGSERNNEHPSRLRARLARWLWLARLVLWWERLWPAFWPAVGTAGLFLAVALFDILPALPSWLHALLLVGFAGALGYALWHGARRFTPPDQGHAFAGRGGSPYGQAAGVEPEVPDRVTLVRLSALSYL